MKVNPGMSKDSLKSELRKKYVMKVCDEPSCAQEYCNKINLADHKRRVHGAEKLKCRDSDCSALFINSAAVTGHMWAKHGIGKGATCEECGKREPKVAYLKNHKRAVHGAPKLQCKEPGCTKTFIYDIDLYNHMKRKHK